MTMTAPGRTDLNVALMTRMYQAFIDADLAAAQSVLSDRLLHHLQGQAWFSGDHSRDSLFGVFAEIYQMSGYTMKVDLITVAANDDYAFAISRHRSERNGVPFETSVFLTAKIEDGQIVEAWECPFDIDALSTFYART